MADLRVRLQPRAGREEVVGERDGAVVIRVAAPPIGGRANDALSAFIARRVRVPKEAVRVVAGMRSRDKLVRVEGVTPGTLRRALGLD
jgi:uncharacterized protein (TIGR00251 family)